MSKFLEALENAERILKEASDYLIANSKEPETTAPVYLKPQATSCKTDSHCPATVANQD